LRNLAALTIILRRLRLDVVLACFVKPAVYGTIAARLAGVRGRFVMIEGLGYAFTLASDRPSIRRRALARLVGRMLKVGLSHAQAVFFLNDDDERLFVERGFIQAALARRINGTGVDLDRFTPAPPVTEPLRFIMVARLLREKGILEFVEAARMIRAEFPATAFVLVGGLDNNPGAISRSVVERWVSEGAIDWLGHIEDVAAELACSSVFVLPSWREGAPRSTQEALAIGKPVITTNAVGARDMVIEGHNGFRVPVQDAIALASAMRKFIKDPSLIARMGEASRALAQTRYDVHVINAAILREMGLVSP
jgi:glycosyltransferase involved in cell wall biosynthesis